MSAVLPASWHSKNDMKRPVNSKVFWGNNIILGLQCNEAGWFWDIFQRKNMFCEIQKTMRVSVCTRVSKFEYFNALAPNMVGVFWYYTSPPATYRLF